MVPRSGGATCPTGLSDWVAHYRAALRRGSTTCELPASASLVVHDVELRVRVVERREVIGYWRSGIVPARHDPIRSVPAEVSDIHALAIVIGHG